VEHREDLTEEAALKSSGAIKKPYKGWHLVVGRCGEPKELTRGDCGSRRKLAAGSRKVSRRAAVAQRKRNFFRRIRTQGNCGPHKELAAAGIKMTHTAEVARSREHRLQRQEKDGIAPKTPKGRTSRVKRWNGPENKIGIMDPDKRRQVHLEIERT
jgi:hypothetical protein